MSTASLIVLVTGAYLIGVFVAFPVASECKSIAPRHIFLWPLYLPHALVYVVRRWLADLWHVLIGG